MKIRLNCCREVGVDGYEGLRALIPKGMDGEALNYGQGEGQLRIGSSVWGFYVEDSSTCYFVLEEGVLDIESAFKTALGILHRIHEQWDSGIQAEIEGIWEHDPTMWELKPPYRTPR